MKLQNEFRIISKNRNKIKDLKNQFFYLREVYLDKECKRYPTNKKCLI